MFEPSLLFPGDNEAAFEWFADFTFYAAQKLAGRKFWVADELQDFIPTNYFPAAAKRILQTGRNYALDVAAIAQGANELNRRLCRQITEVVVFQTFEKRPLEWRAGVGGLTSVRDLKPGEYYARNLRTRGGVRGKVF